MKKLLVLVAVSAMAIASQAAQFDWAADRGALSDYKNLTVYCVNGSDYTAAVAALTAGGASVESSFNAYVQSSATVAAGGSITSVNNLGAEGTAAFFVFADGIADGKTYDTTGAVDVSGSLYTPPDSSPGKFKLANASFTSKGNPIGGGGPEPIPEPTSAMLILLGVAGLALKRKQA